jgi:fumarylpyruvate hydrolase
MSTQANYVIAPPPQAVLAVAGTDKLFPVRRLWCVGRNYVEHIKEMGQDVREPPFFFAKPTDAIVPDGGTVPYPSLTKDMHHEVELVVALKSGGRNIPVAKANDCIYGYGVGIDLTRRDLQIASRDIKRPWEIGKAFDHSAPCGALRPASEIGHPAKGRIVLKVNGKVRQDGDLNQMIWNVPEVISKLSEMVELAAGDIILTGTPFGRRRDGCGRQDRVRDRGRRHAEGDDWTAVEIAVARKQPDRLAAGAIAIVGGKRT